MQTKSFSTLVPHTKKQKKRMWNLQKTSSIGRLDGRIQTENGRQYTSRKKDLIRLYFEWVLNLFIMSYGEIEATY